MWLYTQFSHVFFAFCFEVFFPIRFSCHRSVSFPAGQQCSTSSQLSRICDDWRSRCELHVVLLQVRELCLTTQPSHKPLFSSFTKYQYCSQVKPGQTHPSMHEERLASDTSHLVSRSYSDSLMEESLRKKENDLITATILI